MGIASVVASNVLASSAAEWIAIAASIPYNNAGPISSGADAAFPPANVANGRPGKVCRFKVAGQPAQLGANLAIGGPAIDTCAIINHNLASSAVVWLVHSATIAGPYTYVSIPIVAGKPAWVPVASSSRRYWRLIVEVASTTDGGPVQIGEWWLGTKQDLPPFVWGFERRSEIVDSYSESEFGVPSPYYLAERRAFSGSFQDALTEAEAFAVEDFKRAVQGRVKPFLFIPDTDDRAAVHLGRLAGNTWRNRLTLPGRVNDSDFAFVEDPFGKTGA